MEAMNSSQLSSIIKGAGRELRPSRGTAAAEAAVHLGAGSSHGRHQHFGIGDPSQSGVRQAAVAWGGRSWFAWWWDASRAPRPGSGL